jgi:hypothetical protein
LERKGSVFALSWQHNLAVTISLHMASIYNSMLYVCFFANSGEFAVGQAAIRGTVCLVGWPGLRLKGLLRAHTLSCGKLLTLPWKNGNIMKT